eukprot:TRINITY_DN30627_c0_g1_i1.p1 TRINITY_DN30627_c0_g1~~TRINITY_DN30627_c0_g1_i1.p1  ORF type:complete len:709 (-),score=76.41 TRINITY_DN30627_c0_g1_i1:5-2095(-)
MARVGPWCMLLCISVPLAWYVLHELHLTSPARPAPKRAQPLATKVAVPPQSPAPGNPPLDASVEVESLDPEVWARYKAVTYWVTGNVTRGRDVLIPPRNSGPADPLRDVPPPHPLRGNRSMGALEKAILFCEPWVASYEMFVLECLPRLLRVYPQPLLSLLAQPGRAIQIFSPGNRFAEQFLIEVLHLPSEQVLVLPAHLIWNFEYPPYYFFVKELLHLLPAPATALEERALMVRNVLLGQLSLPPNAAEGIVFSERCDMTMPSEFLPFLSGLATRLQTTVRSVRLETLPVVRQVMLMQSAAALVGPPGNNMLNAIFLPSGATVVEIFADYYQTEFGPRDPKNWTQTAVISKALGLRYVAVMPVSPVQPQKQPKFNPKEVADALLHVNKAHGLARVEHISPPLIGCENLFHKSRCPIAMGLYKQTYIIPGLFALKIARTGEWRRVLKEMLWLRNATEPETTPAVALCFDGRMYAQALIRQLGPHGERKPIRWTNAEDYFLAIAGQLQFWHAHHRRGRFLFYCDPGPKNLGATTRVAHAIPKAALNCANLSPSRAAELRAIVHMNVARAEGVPNVSMVPDRLQMFDFDVAAEVRPGDWCTTDIDCGCHPVEPSACQDNRCTLEGLQAKVNNVTWTAIATLVRHYSTLDLYREDRPTKTLLAAIRSGRPLQCAELRDYLEHHVPEIAKRVPHCTAVWP